MREKMRVKSLYITADLNVRIRCCLLLKVPGNRILYFIHPPPRPQQWRLNLDMLDKHSVTKLHQPWEQK